MTTPPRHVQKIPPQAPDVPEDVPQDVRDVPDVLGLLEGPELHAQLRADTALLAGAAAALRHAATQAAYRGRPRPDHAYALASVLDTARMRWLDQDPAFRARLRTCSRVLLGSEDPAAAEGGGPVPVLPPEAPGPGGLVRRGR